ncbi:MAG: hypothetical protein HYU66_20500, partial [Armatimonadetes bacterium]|nr:hypothetical protein [Armatimonadota bacterium]
MNHSFRPWLPCLAFAFALATAAAGVPLAKFEPEHGCYLGAFIEKDARAQGDYSRFEHLAGHKHACYITYLGYGQSFPAGWVARVQAAGACPHIALEPNGGLNAVNDDAYLHTFARECARSRVPIFMRFASEMNGAWMPYSGDAELYVQKWRLVYRVMQAEAPNVAMVWCVFSMPQRTIAQYYPGDDYVDWVGVNIYSVMYHNNDPSQPAQREDPRDWLRYVYDLYASRKPIMICEYAATSWCRVVDGPTVGFALEKMAALYNSLPREFPRVKCVQWFSWDTVDAGAADNNYSVTGDPIIAAKYRELTSGDYWLGAVRAPPDLLQGSPFDRTLVAAGPGPTKPAKPDVPVVPPIMGPVEPVTTPPAGQNKPAATEPEEPSPDADAALL